MLGIGALLCALALSAAGSPVLQVAVDVNDPASALALMASSQRYDLQQVLLARDERSLYVASTLFLHRFEPADLRHAPAVSVPKTLPSRAPYCPDRPLSRFTLLAEGPAPARDTLFYCQECIHENESALAALPRPFGHTNTSFCVLLRWTGMQLEAVQASDPQAPVFDARLRDQSDPPTGYRLGAVAFVLVDGSLFAFRGIEPTDARANPSAARPGEPYSFMKKLSLAATDGAGFLEPEGTGHPIIFYSDLQLVPLHAFAHHHFVYVLAANNLLVPCARGRACVEPELHLMQHVPAAPRPASDEWKSLLDLQLDYAREQLVDRVHELFSRQRAAPDYSLRLFVNSSVEWAAHLSPVEPTDDTLVGVLLEHRFHAPQLAPRAIDSKQLERLRLYSLHLYSLSDAALNFFSTWLQCACPENRRQDPVLPQFMKSRQSKLACKVIYNRGTKQGSTSVAADSYDALVNQSRSYRDKVAAYANASTLCGRLQPLLSAYLLPTGAREWHALDEPLDADVQEAAASARASFRFTSATAIDLSAAGRSRSRSRSSAVSRFALFLTTDDGRVSELQLQLPAVTRRGRSTCAPQAAAPASDSDAPVAGEKPRLTSSWIEYVKVNRSVRSRMGPIMQLVLTRNDSALLLTSENVYRVNASACWLYSTCAQCMNSGDMFCGWCSLTGRCALRSECAYRAHSAAAPETADKLRNAWLPVADAVCPSAAIEPRYLPALGRSSGTALFELRVTLENVPIARVEVGDQYWRTESNGVWTPLGSVVAPDSQEISRPVNGYICAVEFSAPARRELSQAEALLSPTEASTAPAIYRYPNGFFQLYSINATSGLVRGTCNFRGDFNNFIRVATNMSSYAGDVTTRVELLLNRQPSGGGTRLNANEATLVLYNCSARRSCASCTAEVEAGASCVWVASEQRCVFSQHHNEYLMARAIDSAYYYSSALWITAASACPALALAPSSNVLLKKARRDAAVVALPSDAPFDLQFVIYNARAEWGESPFAEQHSCRVALADAPVGQFEATIRASTRCQACLEFGLVRMSLAGLPPALVDSGLQCQRRLGPNELSSFNHSSPIFAPCRQANESLSLRISCTFHQYAIQPKLFDYDFAHAVSWYLYTCSFWKTCTECLLASSRDFSCTWTDGACRTGRLNSSPDYSICKPQIFKVIPKTGISGPRNTHRVTIIGIDLQSRALNPLITVAGYNCNLDGVRTNNFTYSKRLSCDIIQNIPSPMSGNLEIRQQDGHVSAPPLVSIPYSFVVQDCNKYEYTRKPKITSISPAAAPAYPGLRTCISLQGNYLNAGASESLSITFKWNSSPTQINCKLIARSNTSMTCELRSISLAGAASVSVHLDGYELPFLSRTGAGLLELPFGSFTFYAPISNVKLVKHASIRSGGLLAEFAGENFLESQSFYVSYESSVSKIAHCKVEGSSRLRCLLPPSTASGNASVTEPVRERLALHLLQAENCAGAESARVRRELLLTLTQSASAPADSDSDSFSFSDDYVDAMEPLGPFVVDVHPDPVFEPLSADHQPLYLTQPPLLINGRNLEPLGSGDVYAVVGGRAFQCSKVEQQQQLVCHFDMHQVTLLGRAGHFAPVVGSNLTRTEDANWHLLDLDADVDAEAAAASSVLSASAARDGSRIAHVRRRRFLSSSEPPAYEVYVLVGERASGAGLRQLVGRVQFEHSPSTSRLFMSSYVASGSLAAIGVLAALLLLGCVICAVVLLVVMRHKHERDALLQRSEREHSQWEEQMRLLCRDTFEANNTNLLQELTHGADVRVPFRDYKSFCMRILFPDLCAAAAPLSGAGRPPGALPMYEYGSGTSASLDMQHAGAAVQNELNKHPVLLSLKERMDPAQVEPVTQAMGKFVQLLRHKQFLVLLVRTLEAESAHGGLSMSERLRFASLLSAFLQAKMDTYTQVLMTLLHEQLARLVGEARGAPHERSSGLERDSDAYQSINGLRAASGLSLNLNLNSNSHSPRSRSQGSGLDGGLPASPPASVECGGALHLRTFLRRNESIAEKMLTNWLAFLLYHQLKLLTYESVSVSVCCSQESVGEPLYQLSCAIEYLLSKGPVDAVTHEARYALDENCLLRVPLAHSPIDLTVVQFDPSAVSSSRSRLPVAGSREHLSADQVSVLTGSQFALGPPSALLSSSSQSQSQSRSRSVLQLPSPLSRLDEVAAAASASNSPSKRRKFGAIGVQLGGDSAAEHAADMEREQLLQQQQQLMRQHMHMHDHFAQRPAEKRELRVLDCDSVSQVKRKICSALYEHEAFSSRPHPDAHELVIFPSAPYDWVNWRILRDEDESSEVVENRLKKCNTLRYYLDKLNLRVRSDPHVAEHPELVYETIGDQQANSSFVGTVYVALVHKNALPEDPNAIPDRSNLASVLLNRRMERASRANSRADMNAVNTLGSRAELSLPPAPGTRLTSTLQLKAPASDLPRFHLTQPPLPPNTPLTPTPLALGGALDGDSDSAAAQQQQRSRRRRKARSKRKRGSIRNDAVAIPRLHELYLAIMQHTKKMLDPYADDLFRVIFNSPDITSELDQRSDTNIPLVQLQNGIKSIPVPLCIKFLFDFLDEEYLNNGISDPAIIHSWKSNCLLHRFWVNLIKNPDLIFDMEKTPELESCLSVFADVLAQSSNWQDRALPQDSSVYRQLFLKDILRFQQQIANYYTYIHQSVAETEQDLNAILLQQSRENEFVFDSVSTAFEIYQYCVKFSAPVCLFWTIKRSLLLATLEAESNDFAAKLRKIFNLTHPPPYNEAPAAVGIIPDPAMQLPVSVMAPAISTQRLASNSLMLSYPPTSTSVLSFDSNHNFGGGPVMQAQPHFSAMLGANQVFIPQQFQPPSYHSSQQYTLPTQ